MIDLFHRDGFQRIHIRAGLLDAVFHCVEDTVAAIGRAADGINAQRLILQHGGRNLFHRNVADARRFRMLNHFNIRDGIRAESHLDYDFSIVSIADASVSARRIDDRLFRKSGGKRQHEQAYAQQHADKFSQMFHKTTS